MAPEQIIVATLAVLALLLSAFFSGTESALFSLGPAWTRKIRSKPTSHEAKRLSKLLGDPVGLLSTIIIANLIVNLSFSLLSQHILSQYTGESPLNTLIDTIIITIIIVIIGESIPKSFGIVYNRRLSLQTMAVIYPLYKAAWPFRLFMTTVNERSTRIVDKILPDENKQLSVEEVRIAANLGLEGEHIKPDEFSIIGNILSLASKEARHAMTPRIDLLAFNEDMPIHQTRETMTSKKFSRIPIFKGTPDHMTGYVRHEELAHALLNPEQQNLNVSTLKHQARFVPESRGLLSLLLELQQEQSDVAIVVDEFGGTAGLITLGGISTMALGPMDRRAANAKPPVQVGPHCWILRADTPIEMLHSHFDIPIDDANNDVETVAGFLLNHLGEIPITDQKIEAYGYEFKIRAVRRRRIEEIRLTRLVS